MSLQITATTIDRRPVSSESRPVQEVAPVTAPQLQLPEQQAVQEPPTAKAVQAAAAQIESYLRKYDRSLGFSVDESTGKTVVVVRNRTTGEIVRQIPDAETLRIAARLEQSASALVDLMA
jgi:flagellar protein FlaG